MARRIPSLFSRPDGIDRRRDQVQRLRYRASILFFPPQQSAAFSPGNCVGFDIPDPQNVFSALSKCDALNLCTRSDFSSLHFVFILSTGGDSAAGRFRDVSA